jgi:hypothetical protein
MELVLGGAAGLEFLTAYTRLGNLRSSRHKRCGDGPSDWNLEESSL